MALSKGLLDVLVCPKCKGVLEYEEGNKRMVCRACRLSYDIKDDIPVMLVDQAKSL